MTFSEAHDLMDLLLDKADQPYFTTEEKDKFLNMALFDWFEKACQNFDNNQDLHIHLGPFQREQAVYFESNGAFAIHKSALGPHVVPFRGPTQYAYRSAASPIAKILNLSVRHANEYGLVTHRDKYVVVRQAKSNEITNQAISVDSNNPNRGSDPFNKPTGDDPVYFVRGTNLNIIPWRNEYHGLEYKLQGWSHSDFTGDVTTGDWGNAGRWRLRYLTYPLGSNVNAGNFDIDVLPWGTADVQLGAQTPTQVWDSVAAAVAYSDTGTGVTGWGWPMHICQEIVQNAVRLMTGNIESENYQIQAIESEQSKSI